MPKRIGIIGIALLAFFAGRASVVRTLKVHTFQPQPPSVSYAGYGIGKNNCSLVEIPSGKELSLTGTFSALIVRGNGVTVKVLSPIIVYGPGPGIELDSTNATVLGPGMFQ